MIKAVPSSCTALSLSAPAPQNSRATVRCPDRDDMIKAVSFFASSKEQLGHLQLPGLTTFSTLCYRPALPCLCRCQLHREVGQPSVARVNRHDQGCVIIALPCLCRRRLQRAVRPPPGARLDDLTKGCVIILHCLVLVGASSTEESGNPELPGSTDMITAVSSMQRFVFVGASSAEQSRR